MNCFLNLILKQAPVKATRAKTEAIALIQIGVIMATTAPVNIIVMDLTVKAATTIIQQLAQY